MARRSPRCSRGLRLRLLFRVHQELECASNEVLECWIARAVAELMSHPYLPRSIGRDDRRLLQWPSELHAEGLLDESSAGKPDPQFDFSQ
jgi:hypothetical protein